MQSSCSHVLRLMPVQKGRCSVFQVSISSRLEYTRMLRASAAPQAAEHEFDIVGHPRAAFQFAVVFPFHPAGPGQAQHEVRALHAHNPWLL